MSNRERQRRSKRARVLCAACQGRKARFKYRGVVRADRDHTLCFACYRRERDRARAHRLVQGPAPLELRFAHHDGMRTRPLDDRQLAHRQQMLDHLQRQSFVAS